jgi:uncharacterized membrane protein YbhN (UPF0104 family)
MHKLIHRMPAWMRAPNGRRWLKRGLTFALAAVVLSLAGMKLAEVDWRATASAVASVSWPRLGAAISFALPALAACAAYDLIGRRVTGHDLSRPRTMLISFTGYFDSLNLGAIVGGLALRYRLYMPYGFRPLTIGQIIGLSVLTNWMGFVVIAGVVLAFDPPELLENFAPGLTLRLAGILCLLTAAGYLVFCHFRGNRTYEIRGTVVTVPTVPLGMIQLALASTNWAAMGAIIAWLLPTIGFSDVIPVLMASALAGIWSHVPGGLGVTEAVFVTLLGDRVPTSELVASVLIFRGIYYFVPLLVALGAYAWLESTASRIGDTRVPA